jgi:hypothetical protein
MTHPAIPKSVPKITDLFHGIQRVILSRLTHTGNTCFPLGVNARWDRPFGGAVLMAKRVAIYAEHYPSGREFRAELNE